LNNGAVRPLGVSNFATATWKSSTAAGAGKVDRDADDEAAVEDNAADDEAAADDEVGADDEAGADDDGWDTASVICHLGFQRFYNSENLEKP